MWPFTKKQPEKRTAFDNPRYAENPIYLFAELYVLDTIGHMPPEKNPQDMNLQSVFNTKASEWRDVIAEVLHFSETINIAILDLWHRNKHHYNDPWHFAQDFIDKYNEDDSKVDVWPEGTLEAARSRIAAAQAEDA